MATTIRTETKHRTVCDGCGAVLIDSSQICRPEFYGVHTLSMTIHRPSQFQSAFCNHVDVLELCNTCWEKLLATYPALAKNWKELRDTERSYRGL